MQGQRKERKGEARKEKKKGGNEKQSERKPAWENGGTEKESKLEEQKSKDMHTDSIARPATAEHHYMFPLARLMILPVSACDKRKKQHSS